MERPRRDEEHIAARSRHAPHHIEQAAVRNPLMKLRPRNLPRKSVDDLSPRRSICDVPHLCFTVLARRTQRIVVIRMYLHRQIVMRIDEFDEQRKIGKARRIPAEHLLPRTRKPRLKGLSCRRTVRDDALSIPMAGEFPALSNDGECCLFAVLIPQACTAPEIILQRCIEFHRISHNVSLTVILCWIKISY